ncbi:putative Ctr copper transporter [Talaromyces proteolyticus]|uniref:Copper transport protein n=1 Tax=Talaromyces proteolyticus TaxID=1131652 RepID=A0AAD4KF62_9EURO|nr:putative Ctr copper transporter [Talaromyces proteolyticus]KAH8688813.1 putative Ctr copper transporter [Talaromyces proteolyticus]
MDMGMSSGTSMVFSNSQTTPLYSSSWTPATSGQYAGTCIFLIVLAIIARLLVAFKAAMERKWLATALNRRYVVIAGKPTESDIINSTNVDPDSAKTALLTTQGIQENVKVVRRLSQGPQPWRFSVDLPRALLFLCITGVGYLLMLAVMTLNIGYFMSVLAGAFIGELAVGRHIEWNEH